jgi:murein DD-endopeptidase MepM/ murein hydrolase activator NlpD
MIGKVAAGGGVLLVGGCLAAGLTAAALIGGAATDAGAAISCSVTIPDGAGDSTNLNQTQLRNAATIISKGQDLGIDPTGLVIAIDVALTESSLMNDASQAVPESLNYPHDQVVPGDHDSVGLFQQRANWGTVEQRMTPLVSARLFYQGGTAADGYSEPGLTDIDYSYMTVAQAAQAVQVSAYPSAYEQWVNTAVATVKALANADMSSTCNGGGSFTPGEWVNPIDPDNDGVPDYLFTATFGECSSLWESCHTGLDMAVPEGTPVYADHAGTVIFAGWGGDYGNLVEIDHHNGVVTYYGHNSVLLVHKGDQVKTGQRVSMSGATGNVTGPHLHYEIRINGTPVDPYTFMVQHHVPHHQL